MKNRITPARIFIMAAMLGAAAAIAFIMTRSSNKFDKKGYIGKSGITIEDGKMTPEVLLAFGRLSEIGRAHV